MKKFILCFCIFLLSCSSDNSNQNPNENYLDANNDVVDSNIEEQIVDASTIDDYNYIDTDYDRIELQDEVSIQPIQDYDAYVEKQNEICNSHPGRCGRFFVNGLFYLCNICSTNINSDGYFEQICILEPNSYDGVCCTFKTTVEFPKEFCGWADNGCGGFKFINNCDVGQKCLTTVADSSYEYHCVNY
jgi:hypothetical protein